MSMYKRAWEDHLEFYDQAILSFLTLRDFIVAYIQYEDNPEKLIDLMFAMETDIPAC